MRVRRFVVGLGVSVSLLAGAQKPVEPAPAAPIERRDAALDVAAGYIGRALFLRCFCAENTLSFDAQGKATGAVKTEDWTLAGVNVAKVERKAPGSIEMEGVRVAIRYNTDQHIFERHPQTDEKMRITVADTGDAKEMERVLGVVFAQGIDLPLQRAMPSYWRHYFDPKLEWAADGLNGQTIYTMYSTGATSEVTQPRVTHRVDATYTAFALHDRVKGVSQLRMVVDAQGEARRVAIAQPLGYGLDERAVDALTKFKFAPAMKGGTAVASVVLLDEEFVAVPVAR